MRRRPLRPGHHLAPAADPEARYRDLGPDWHQRKTDTDRRIRHLISQLRALHPDAEITIPPAA